jgi:hypothetical protein
MEEDQVYIRGAIITATILLIVALIGFRVIRHLKNAMVPLTLEPSKNWRKEVPVPADCIEEVLGYFDAIGNQESGELPRYKMWRLLKEKMPEFEKAPSGTAYSLSFHGRITVIFEYSQEQSYTELTKARSEGKPIESLVNNEWVPCHFGRGAGWTLPKDKYRVAPPYISDCLKRIAMSDSMCLYILSWLCTHCS